MSPFCLELYPQSSSSVMSGRMAGNSTALPCSVAAFCGAKKYNPCLRNVLILYLGTVKTQQQLQMLSRKVAQGKVCLKCSTLYKTGIDGPMKPISD